MKSRSDRATAAKIRWVIAIYGILMAGIVALIIKEINVL